MGQSGAELVSLATPEQVLEQCAGPVAHFIALVGLPRDQVEPILISSLRRLAGWVSNLPLDRHPVFAGVLLCGSSALEQMSPDAPPALRLAKGLVVCFESLAQALPRLRVTRAEPQGQGQDPGWGFVSSSLWGWSQARDISEVWVSVDHTAEVVPGLHWLMMGRVLSGITIDWLEQEDLLQEWFPRQARHEHAAALLLPALSKPVRSGMKQEADAIFQRQIRLAIHSLQKRGVWNLKTVQGRIFRCQDQVMLLWPLGGRDLFNERQGQEHPFQRPLSEMVFDEALERSWREQLIRAGCLMRESEDGMVEAWHPLWKRFVKAVRFTPAYGGLFRGE